MNYPDRPVRLEHGSGTQFLAELAQLETSPDAQKWSGARTFRAEWDECRSPRWMLYLLVRLRPDNQAAQLCAALAQKWAARASAINAADAARYASYATNAAKIFPHTDRSAEAAALAAIATLSEAAECPAETAADDIRNALAFPVLT